MVKLIMGLSGSGKTKTLISLVSEAIEKEQGNVVCIEKSRHLTYDIPYQARLIRTDDYGVRGNTMLLGFLCGLHAGNYDITHFFIDDLNKILDDRSNEALEKFLDTLSAFGERENINFTITITASRQVFQEFVYTLFFLLRNNQFQPVRSRQPQLRWLRRSDW